MAACFRLTMVIFRTNSVSRCECLYFGLNKPRYPSVGSRAIVPGETIKHEMCETCSTHWSVKYVYKILIGKSENMREIFVFLGCYAV